MMKPGMRGQSSKVSYRIASDIIVAVGRMAESLGVSEAKAAATLLDLGLGVLFADDMDRVISRATRSRDEHAAALKLQGKLQEAAQMTKNARAEFRSALTLEEAPFEAGTQIRVQPNVRRPKRTGKKGRKPRKQRKVRK